MIAFSYSFIISIIFSSEWLLISPVNSQASGTTLVGKSDLIDEKLDVVSSSILPIFIFERASAAINIALIPFSGSIPAWAFLPLNVAFTKYLLGAEWATVPAVPELSRTIMFLAGCIWLGTLSQSIFLAPNMPISSAGVNIANISLWAIFSSFIVLIASITAATPPLSSAPRVVVPSVFMIKPSSITLRFSFGSITSMWAEKVIPSPGTVPANFAKIVGLSPSYFTFPLSK